MEKIKHLISDITEGEKGKDVLIVIIVILVGLGSYELGRLSKGDDSSGLKIDYTAQVGTISPPLNSNNDKHDSNSQNTLMNQGFSSNLTQKAQNIRLNSGNYFASSKGHKYYTTGCSAGKTIKQENRVYFNSSTDAEKAGYTLSSACR